MERLDKMNEGYVLVYCLDCGSKELTPMFTGDLTDDLHCSNCGSHDIEVW